MATTGLFQCHSYDKNVIVFFNRSSDKDNFLEQEIYEHDTLGLYIL